MEKVKLPHDVAKCIEKLRGMDFEINNRSIITAFCNEYHDGYPALVDYSRTNFNDLMLALVIGYEVEETPEDKVRELYKTYEVDPNSEGYETGYHEGVQFAIIETLNLLNIKIEGIN